MTTGTPDACHRRRQSANAAGRRLGLLVVSALVTAWTAGCSSEDSTHPCDTSHGVVGTAAGSGCVDPDPAECVGERSHSDKDVLWIRSDGPYSGSQAREGKGIRVESAEVRGRSASATLVIDPADGPAEERDVAIGQVLSYRGHTFRVVKICDSRVVQLARMS
jgi:hypothetical protein